MQGPAWTNGVSKFRVNFKRIPQKIPLPWAEDPASKRLLKRNEFLIGDKSRLPRHYVEFYKKWEIGPQAFIHDEPPKGRWEKNEFGNVQRVQVPRIPVLYPEEFHQGLWGGEGIIKGLRERNELKAKNKHEARYIPPEEFYWYPELHFGVVYSEILNKHIEVVMTERAQRLIDEAFGLDNYLLKTEVNEIYSHFGLKLKRELLLTLANSDDELYPYDASKRKDIYDKYKDFVVSHEEADWHGLPLKEALYKQHTIDRIEEENSIEPKKHEYRQQLLARVESHPGDYDDFEFEDEEEKSNLMDKMKFWKK